MHRRALLAALSSIAVVGLGAPGASFAEEGFRLSGPFVHDNLAIYLVHGRSAPGPVPLTLQEAMAKGAVRVYETSNVNELQIENLGENEVFVQSGDIVKGGKQDRVLMVSLVVPPKSGRLPIASFCVEQGRWAARGSESAARFASADAALPSRKAKMAMRAPVRAAAPEPSGRPDADVLRGLSDRVRRHLQRGDAASPRGSNETGERQRAVWQSVADTQYRLSSALGQPVAAPASKSSLQLSLENEKLRKTQAAYVQALKGRGEKADDIVGYVFAINGKLNSGDVYPSNALFRKMWPKLLNASVTEAIGERAGAAETLPSNDAVLAFLAAAESGQAEHREVLPKVRLESRENDRALYSATLRADGGWVHRSYLAK